MAAGTDPLDEDTDGSGRTGADAFTVDTTHSNGGVQGVATSGLLWESTLFWRWSGACYGSSSWSTQKG